MSANQKIKTVTVATKTRRSGKTRGTATRKPKKPSAPRPKPHHGSRTTRKKTR